MGRLGRVRGMLGVRGASQTSQEFRSSRFVKVHRLQDQVEVPLLLGLLRLVDDEEAVTCCCDLPQVMHS